MKLPLFNLTFFEKYVIIYIGNKKHYLERGGRNGKKTIGTLPHL